MVPIIHINKTLLMFSCTYFDFLDNELSFCFVLYVIWGSTVHGTCCAGVWVQTRPGWLPKTFFSTHGNQLPSRSGVHGFKDFLCSDHLLESFAGRIYSYGSVLKSKFVHQRIHEDEHYRDNPSNHELLTVRGVDCRASKKMFWGVIPV